jgi:hypothetical protein
MLSGTVLEAHYRVSGMRIAWPRHLRVNTSDRDAWVTYGPGCPSITREYIVTSFAVMREKLLSRNTV